ncbi:hypothetical protein CF8_0181 [Aeromonas phage CF8]|nr:hypothetical protein CF8_0181 [Aeromonas phage CF8]
MTLIAFDGKHLVVDGASTLENPRYKKSGDVFHLMKIVVPNFKWYDEESKHEICALVGTGTTSDIKDVIEELMVAGKLELPGHDHFTRIQKLLRERVHCQIVTVGFDYSTGEKQPWVGSLFKSIDFEDSYFRYSRFNPTIPAIAGYTEEFPKWELGKGWNNAVEIVSLGAVLYPEKIGGLLTRFNLETGKLDHPKLTGNGRLNKMLYQYEKERLAEIKKKFSKAREFVASPINTY